MSTPNTQMVGIDTLDAAELAELCEYVADWIKQAPVTVIESLVRFGASAHAPDILLDDLGRFADLLVRLVPVGSTADTPRRAHVVDEESQASQGSREGRSR